jgi:hypothetical protein
VSSISGLAFSGRIFHSGGMAKKILSLESNKKNASNNTKGIPGAVGRYLGAQRESEDNIINKDACSNKTTTAIHQNHQSFTH